MEVDSKLNLNSNDFKIFKKKLKFLYKKIDSSSSLLWSHDNRLTGAKGKRLRSELDNDEKESKWKNKETTQTGYGEIAMVKIYLIPRAL
jgi:hypothetical protein